MFSENLKVGQFLQKGFQSEHLYTTLERFEVVLSPTFDLNLFFFNYRAVIIYCHNQEILQKIFQLFSTLKIKFLIVVLSDFNINFKEFIKEENNIIYFVKPFNFRFITAEIKFQLFQSTETVPRKSLKFRDIVMNLETHEVFYKEEKIFLRNKEFELLHFLMVNEGKLLSRLTILENVWDLNANFFTNTVDVHISRLRKALKISNLDHSYIQTVPCSGYIFS